MTVRSAYFNFVTPAFIITFWNCYLYLRGDRCKKRTIKEIHVLDELMMVFLLSNQRQTKSSVNRRCRLKPKEKEVVSVYCVISCCSNKNDLIY